MAITSILAMDLKCAIGVDNALPWILKDDMAFFKKVTINNTVVMGRLTFESLGNTPLPKRKNIVISSQPRPDDLAEEVLWMNITQIHQYLVMNRDNEEIFIIGGAKVYNSLNQYAETILLTRVFTELDSSNLKYVSLYQLLDKDYKLTENILLKGADERNQYPFIIQKYTVNRDLIKRLVSHLFKSYIEDFRSILDDKEDLNVNIKYLNKYSLDILVSFLQDCTVNHRPLRAYSITQISSDISKLNDFDFLNLFSKDVLIKAMNYIINNTDYIKAVNKALLITDKSEVKEHYVYRILTIVSKFYNSNMMKVTNIRFPSSINNIIEIYYVDEHNLSFITTIEL